MNVREYRKADQKIEVNFVNHKKKKTNTKAKPKEKLYLSKQLRGGFNTQCNGNKNKRWELMRLIFMYGQFVNLLYSKE
jgi:hypothetical protein